MDNVSSKMVFSAFADSLSGNRGAVSMLQSVIDNLTPKNIEIAVFSVYYRRDLKLPRQPGVTLRNGGPVSLVFLLTPLAVLWRLLHVFGFRRPPRWFGKDFVSLWESEVGLMIGGTTFSDAQKIKIVYNVFCMLPAIILGKKCLMVSQTMGPFNTWFNHVMAKVFLSRMSVIVPRGLESLAHVRSLKLPEAVHVEYYDDAAFSLVVPEEVDAMISERFRNVFRGKKLVGLSVNSIVQRKCRELGIDYLGAWVKFIDCLTDEGYGVLLIPHSIREGAKTDHNNDLLAVDDILSAISPVAAEKITVVRENFDCKQLRDVVGLTDIYVSSRFHAMISALCTETPVLVFGWGFQKYREVMRRFELEEYCFDCREISAPRLIAEFKRVEHDCGKIAGLIRKNAPRVRASSLHNHEAALALAVGGEIPAGLETE